MTDCITLALGVNKARQKKVKIRFIPPSLFLSAICFSDVFSDYKTFSSMAFLLEMHSLGDIG